MSESHVESLPHFLVTYKPDGSPRLTKVNNGYPRLPNKREPTCSYIILHAVQRAYMQLHEPAWSSMGLYAVAWAWMQFHELTYSFMILLAVPWAYMQFHQLSCSSMSLHAVPPSAFMQFHELSCYTRSTKFSCLFLQISCTILSAQAVLGGLV